MLSMMDFITPVVHRDRARWSIALIAYGACAAISAAGFGALLGMCGRALRQLPIEYWAEAPIASTRRRSGSGPGAATGCCCTGSTARSWQRSRCIWSVTDSDLEETDVVGLHSRFQRRSPDRTAPRL